MTSLGESVAVGVEEEFHVVDLETRHLVPRAGNLLNRLPNERFTEELQRSVVESNSRPYVRLEDLGHDLTALRRTVTEAADGLGLGIVAAGTVPLVDPAALEISPDARYEQMLEDYQLLTREQLICGAQVHVDVSDRDLAVEAAHRVAPWLPPLLALSASSPYWFGADSGYASYRTLVWQRWPTTGPVRRFSSAAEYDQMVADLVRSGVISDPGMIYFDVRPSRHLPTVELRMCDACPRVEDVVLLAGIFRALVLRELHDLEAGVPMQETRTEMVRAATWRSARSGLEGMLVDPVEGTAMPAGEVIRRMLTGLRPQLEATGDWELVTLLTEAALARGSSAARQRKLMQSGGTCVDVVDMLVAETRADGWHELYGGPLPGLETTLLKGYEVVKDEAVIEGIVREPYQPVFTVLDRLGAVELRERETTRNAYMDDNGMAFRVGDGEDQEATPEHGTGQDGRMPVDLVPRLVAADDWAMIEEGMPQRVRALEAFVRDVYGRREAIRDGVVPGWVVEESTGFRPTGLRVHEGSVRCSVAGLDLARDGAGRWMVLEDNLRVPSGIGYAVANRRLAAHIVPELDRSHVHDPEGTAALLRETLLAASPVDDPALAVVTSGRGDPAYFEHSLLAEEMGVPLVLPADLTVDDGVVRAAGRRVDVLYRRINEDDLLAAPIGNALLAAMERGTLTLANAPGNGVADDKSLYRYVPQLIDYYLGERPLLANVPTYLCRDEHDRENVLDRLTELVVKPVDGFGGHGVVIGQDASAMELEELRKEILAAPERWVAQETVALSTHPTFDGDRMRPHVIDLRAFVLLGREGVVPRAALTRVAPPDSMIVNSSKGGGAKDTWLMKETA
ncbi:carboxylate--amine ligase/circularly permuted type 2 ATP-grasp protein [Sphaerisporangium sp. TRM90804]|uniref:carboxylate--amine ligase/circularly permuted type 2 ATP-grasp protein n=1 Tax=Sphaerisporangium sp. TRM90804 TaxID=3031113 RepID=UPI00244B89AD|nr:carboxylate--amine ligase/circularly permuted type 2 ATP-grasp protein [Sphaerisporangium sp. TRM90804]MDH2430129.1 carboxylate--amine ligase/circularly permuted type 2 ATP-grasp protein [Sphaerisporangium sp. TRM90804]